MILIFLIIYIIVFIEFFFYFRIKDKFFFLLKNKKKIFFLLNSKKHDDEKFTIFIKKIKFIFKIYLSLFFFISLFTVPMILINFYHETNFNYLIKYLLYFPENLILFFVVIFYLKLRNVKIK